jgi:deoxyribodipyrimidine photolyase-related protein
MPEALIVFPHQLFEDNAQLARGKRVFLVEDALFFRQYAFHQQKLVLHRAAMQAHAAELRAAGIAVEYLDAAAAPDMAVAICAVAASAPRCLHAIDPVDDWLERRLRREAAAAGLALEWHPTPMFLSSPAFLQEHFAARSRVMMASFYQAQRKALGVLVERGKPVGGRWSFDAENRKRLPRSVDIPPPEPLADNDHVVEARAYVAAHFGANPGAAADFAWPVTRADARQRLRDFVAHRLPRFGDYEDAIAANEAVLFHSQLTPMLNIGLLTPREVLDAALGASGVPLNSLEGFVRQLIGWREFMRASYVYKGRVQRTRNFWRHTRPLPRAFWQAGTGIAPLDTVIRRVLRHAYAHHIERLMVLANFMLLCGFCPHDVYRWFMEMFIDAYDWVMVPNVYGMALHADGGLITTKPYVSGSNYLLKMSDFDRGGWCETWDALFWEFIAAHRDFFAANPRLGVMARQLDRMAPARRSAQQQRAAAFLAAL